MAENYEYTTINGHERYNQLESNDYIVDFKQFIIKDSNVVSFNLSAVMKLLPYDGFYPQERTKQIAGLFNDVYLNNSDINDTKKYSTTEEIIETDNKVLTITQPLFSPGILFNTIKAGIAVDWPTRIANSVSTEYFIDHIYTGSGEVNGPLRVNFNDSDPEEAKTVRIPFEALIEPGERYAEAFSKNNLNDDRFCLSYLNPSHYNKDLKDYIFENIFQYSALRNYPSCSYVYIENHMLNATKKSIYKSAINNFLYETVNFFLEDSTLTSFRSNYYNVDTKIGVKSNTTYAMNVKIKKSTNFSMFNRTINNVSEDEGVASELLITSASLFGPPVDDEANGNNYNKNSMYYPYTPPYFLKNDEDIVTLYFDSGDRTEYTLKEILANLQSVNRTLDQEATSLSITNAMRLDSCLKWNLTSENDDGKIAWFIQTKFETPLINFDKCSYISGSKYYSVE